MITTAFLEEAKKECGENESVIDVIGFGLFAPMTNNDRPREACM